MSVAVAAVGASGIPVNVGEIDKTAFPVPVDDVTPVPPLATGRVPDTCVVNPTLPQDGATPVPPDINVFPVAILASFAKVVAPEAYIISPVV